jgi:molybdate transport system regulatory protein
MRTLPRKLPRKLPLQPRVKAWLVAGDEFLMGPRYVRLLEEIDRRGSIREACSRIGLSYRTCLNRIRRMERVLGAPVIHTTRGGTAGGGSELTAEAREIIRLYRKWRTELERSSDEAFRRLRRRG